MPAVAGRRFKGPVLPVAVSDSGEVVTPSPRAARPSGQPAHRYSLSRSGPDRCPWGARSSSRSVGSRIATSWPGAPRGAVPTRNVAPQSSGVGQWTGQQLTDRRRRPATSSPRLPGHKMLCCPRLYHVVIDRLDGSTQADHRAQHHDDRQWRRRRDDASMPNQGKNRSRHGRDGTRIWPTRRPGQPARPPPASYQRPTQLPVAGR